MANLYELVALADRELAVDRFSDYCPNGLQVEGRVEVRRILSGVTASQALIEAALDDDADVLLVHHGFFWKGESPCVRGMRRQRLKSLLSHDVSLLAYHLPLDAHPVLGNNVRLGELLGLQVEAPLGGEGSRVVGLQGTLDMPMSASDFARRVAERLGREPLLIDNGRPVRRVAWCSGGGQGYIDVAAQVGVDLYLTGEASEQTYHSAREQGLAFIAAGHHATERYGVQALGAYLAEHFGIEHRFVDCPNPI